jgi:hypothetical protein
VAWGYPKAVVTTLLGLIGLAFFIVGVVSLAAGVTWTVVMITPAEKRPKPSSSSSSSS